MIFYLLNYHNFFQISQKSVCRRVTNVDLDTEDEKRTLKTLKKEHLMANTEKNVFA